jgi:hypothetical protein
MNVLTLEELKNTAYRLGSVLCETLTENCIVALEHYKHVTGCKLSVSGALQSDFEIRWDRKINKAGYKEPKRFTEFGAIGLSFFLCAELTEFVIIEEALHETGIDYWLDYNEQHELYDIDNSFRARLEISGIGKETPGNTVQDRIKAKKLQTKKSDETGLHVYISVIEFASPKAHFEKK